MIKVAFSGTHGTKKTTNTYGLSYLLKKAGKRVEMITDIERGCPYPKNEKGTKEAQLWIMMNQIEKEIEAENRTPDYIVTDKTVMDIYAYFLFIRKGREMEMGQHQRILTCLMENWFPTYNYIFTIPFNKKKAIHDDGIRSLDKQFQIETDRTMKDLYNGGRIEVPGCDKACKILIGGGKDGKEKQGK